MESVFKNSLTKALPTGARIIVRKPERPEAARALGEYLGLEFTNERRCESLEPHTERELPCSEDCC
jgi:hypothetical protein